MNEVMKLRIAARKAGRKGNDEFNELFASFLKEKNPDLYTLCAGMEWFKLEIFGFAKDYISHLSSRRTGR